MGLSTEEARARRAQYGANELPIAGGVSVVRVALRQLRSPLIYILIVASLVTIAIGEYIDAAMITAVIAFNSVVGTLQEYRAERSMEALRRVPRRARMRSATVVSTTSG